MNRIYLAGPITGLTHEGASGWRDQVATIFGGMGFECFSPMRHTDNLKGVGVIQGNEEYQSNVMTTAKGVMSRDFFDVKRADLLLVNLLGTKRVSIGTVMEIGWAWHMQKPVVVIAEPDNEHVTHLMMQEAISVVVPDIATGIRVVQSYLQNHIGVPR